MKKCMIFVISIVLLSCEALYIKNEWGSDKLSSFDYLTAEIEDHYVYTELKGLDLTALNTTYRAQISNDMDDISYFTVLSDYMNELKDGHANIIAPFATSSSYSYITGYEEDDYNPNFNSRLITLNYLQDDEILGSSLTNGIIHRDGKSYGYIYYSSFMNSISSYEIEFILDRFSEAGVEGVILDIRSNGGGNLLNMVTLVSYLGYNSVSTSAEVVKVWRRDSLTTYTQIESLDMTLGVSVPFVIGRADQAYTGPVALLTNRGSYSASSFTATAFKTYSNVWQIGDDTGGGMGLPYGGTLPNGWNFRYSSNITMDVRADSYEDDIYNYEDGVPADLSVVDDQDTDSVDEIIEAALSWIDSW